MMRKTPEKMTLNSVECPDGFTKPILGALGVLAVRLSNCGSLRAGVLLLAVCGACAPTFEPQRLARHIEFLAGDALEGRGVGTPGIDEAADYIARQFKRAGLDPAGGASFFQPFEVTLQQKLQGRAFLTVDGTAALGVLYRDYVPLPFTATRPFEGPVAFAGYGITNKDANYDDYAGLDAAGKVLLMFRYEPPWPQKEDKQEDAEDPHAAGPSPHALFETKAAVAREHGAAAILIVNALRDDDLTDHLYRFDGVGRTDSYGIPMMHVSREFASRLLAAAGAPDLTSLQKAIDANLQPHSMMLDTLTARGNPGVIRPRATTRNVIGCLPGRGPLTGEYIVIGAHYDHLGVTVPRNAHSASQPASLDPQIHNGADDNASGTAAVIELARVFAAHRPRGPHRSLLFMAFSGEEIGLLGSDHFVDHPTVPLDRIAAMLNLDMVGRMHDRRLQVLGVKTGSEFDSLVRREAETLGLDLKTSGGGFGPSDQTSFYKKKIPVMHFFTGVHRDYHLPTDDADRINADGTADVTRFVYHVAAALACSTTRPTYVSVAEEGPRRTRLKVRMGVMPSYVDEDQPGMTLDGVSPDSPAERAGLREGDQLLFVGDVAIDNVYDLMHALGSHDPGDTTVVTVLRDGRHLKFPLTFEAP